MSKINSMHLLGDRNVKQEHVQDFLGSKILHTNENVQNMANEFRLRHLALMKETKNSRKSFPSYLA